MSTKAMIQWHVIGLTPKGNRLTGRAQTPLLPKFLSSGRYLIILAVVSTFVAAAATFLWGTVRMLQNVSHLLQGLLEPGDALSATQGVHMIAVVDSFLLAIVLYIFSIALYELFIGPLDVPDWLVIHNLDGLKLKLVSVIILVMAVTFVEHLVEWVKPMETLMFGGAIALVLLSLVVFSLVAGKGHGKEENDTGH